MPKFTLLYVLSITRAKNALHDVATTLSKEGARMVELGRHDDANALYEALNRVEATMFAIQEDL